MTHSPQSPQSQAAGAHERMYGESMKAALREAAAAAAVGEVPIGAVVVDADGAIIAAGRNERETTHDPLAHAEVLALQRAAQHLGRWRLDECTLVVTLEPCAMCAGAIGQSRIGRLVFGAFDPKAGAVGSLWDVVRDARLPHRPEVVSGVLGAECAEVLSAFFQAQR